MLTQLKAARERDGRVFHVSVYDNGVPIVEAPWERTRFQSLDVWRTNGTLDGTLSWYSVDSYGRRDPWTTQHWMKNCTGCSERPSGFGVELWPPPPGLRDQEVWNPVETIVWTMLGAGLQDAEYLYALSKHQALLGPTATSLMEYAHGLASAFPSNWFPPSNDWGDAGYAVDTQVHPNGSGSVNTWKLAMGQALDTLDDAAMAPTAHKTDDASRHLHLGTSVATTFPGGSRGWGGQHPHVSGTTARDVATGQRFRHC